MAGHLKFISQEDIRLDMSVRLMICLFVLESRLFDMCSWGRIERNVRLEGSFLFSILGHFLGENCAGYELQDRYFGCGISREILIRKRSRLYCYAIFYLI